MAQQVTISANGIFDRIKGTLASWVTAVRAWLDWHKPDELWEEPDGDLQSLLMSWDEMVEVTTSELANLEAEYGMSSAEFYEKYRQGEMPDTLDTTYWAFQYRTQIDIDRVLAGEEEKPAS